MLVVTVAVVFVNLGLWQLRRADERRMVNTVGQSRIGEEPLPLETLLDAAGDDISSLEYRPATATGVFDSGTRLLRMLVTVRAEAPRKRVDVIPVTYWDPPDELVDDPPERGRRIWVCGSVQRRFWESTDGRRSRVEVVAEQVNVKDVTDLEPVASTV